MSKRTKTRFVIAGGIVAITIIALLAFVGGGTSAKTMTVAQATDASAAGKRIEVSGVVVNDSFSISGNVLHFAIYDEANPNTVLEVSYDKGVSATFGNGVTAICTGTIENSGVLRCTELVTKCPSKYETATEAISVEKLLSYGDTIIDKTVKVTGAFKAETLADSTADIRFVLADANDPTKIIPVQTSVALPDTIDDGSSLVLTGALGPQGKFVATIVALGE